MKAIIGILLFITVIFAASMALYGCSKVPNQTPNDNSSAQQSETGLDTSGLDATGADMTAQDPDLGTLDNSSVSDELPQ